MTVCVNAFVFGLDTTTAAPRRIAVFETRVAHALSLDWLAKRANAGLNIMLSFIASVGAHDGTANDDG